MQCDGHKPTLEFAMSTTMTGLGWPGRTPGTREPVVMNTRYIVPYRVRGNTIEVLRVFHTSRRPPPGW